MTSTLLYLTAIPVVAVCWLLWSSDDQPEPEGEEDYDDLYLETIGAE
jgi:hypothetical protein